MQVVYQDLNVKCVILAALQSYDTYNMSDTPVPFRAADTIWLFNHTHKLHQVLQSHIMSYSPVTSWAAVTILTALKPPDNCSYSALMTHYTSAGAVKATKSIIHNWQSLAIHYRYGPQHIPGLHREISGHQMMILPQIKAFACLLANCRLFYMGQLSGTSVLMNICSADNWPV